MKILRMSVLLAGLLALVAASALAMPVPDILMLHMDEGTGTTAYDSAGYANNGSFGGDPQWAPGRLGAYALEFDGDDSLTCVNHASLNPTGAMSVEAWVRLTAPLADQGSFAAPIYKYGGNAGYYLEMASAWDPPVGATHFGLRDGVGVFHGTREKGQPDDLGWHHIVGTFNGSVQKLYIDGVEEASSPWSDTIGVNTGNLRIGVNGFEGVIDEMAIYSRGLTADEVWQRYTGPQPPANVLILHMDEGSGNTAYDASGNHNDGTLSPSANPPGWTAGKFGSALDLDGVNDSINCGDDASLNLTDAFTIEAWVKHQGTQSYNFGPVVGKRGGSAGYMFGARSNRTLTLTLDGWTTTKTSAATVNDDDWSFVAAVFDGASNLMGVYIDGTWQTWSDGSIPSFIHTTARGLAIGQEYDSETYHFYNFNGLIDEVAIYNYALTKAQLDGRYAGGPPITPEPATVALMAAGVLGMLRRRRRVV